MLVVVRRTDPLPSVTWSSTHHLSDPVVLEVLGQSCHFERKQNNQLTFVKKNNPWIYDDFSRLLFLHAHREVSALTNELLEESDQFRFFSLLV